MLRIRRISAFLLGMLLVQVTILGAASGCSIELTSGAAMPTAAAAHGDVNGHASHHGQHGNQESTRQGTQGHDRSHCTMAMTCAMASMASREVALAEPVIRVTASVTGGDLATPRSLGQAPEPPPPRV